MKLFVRERGFYVQVFAIAAPIAFQNLITFGISMADTVMLGMLGEVALSSASIANQLGFIFMLLCFGIGSGSGVLIAQYWGKGDTVSISKVVTMMYRILIASSVFFTVLAVFFPKNVVSLFTTDTPVIETAASFLRIVGTSYLLSGIASSTIIMLRSVRTVKISLIVYLTSLITNVFLNWVLIFGNLGAPALGVEGAAIATCVSRVAEALIVFFYMLFFEKKIRYKLRDLFSRKLGILAKFIENALPVVINELLWGSGVAVIAVIIGRMGTEFVAASAICSVLSQLVMVALFGVANATAVIVGNTVGSGEYQKAKEYSVTFLAISFLLGLMACAVVLLLREPMLSLYNISSLAKIYGRQIMTIFSVVAVFSSLACTMLIGVLRGGGDTRFVLFMDLIFMWLICIPLGFYTGLYLHWPVWAVYIVIKSDELFKVVFSLLRIARGNWINDITLTQKQKKPA